jgi:hypothetical protein
MKTLIKLSVVVLGMVVFASCKTGPKETTSDVDTTAVEESTAPDATTVDTTAQTQDSAAVDTTQTTK